MESSYAEGVKPEQRRSRDRRRKRALSFQDYSRVMTGHTDAKKIGLITIGYPLLLVKSVRWYIFKLCTRLYVDIFRRPVLILHGHTYAPYSQLHGAIYLMFKGR